MMPVTSSEATSSLFPWIVRQLGRGGEWSSNILFGDPDGQFIAKLYPRSSTLGPSSYVLWQGQGG